MQVVQPIADDAEAQRLQVVQQPAAAQIVARRPASPGASEVLTQAGGVSPKLAGLAGQQAGGDAASSGRWCWCSS